LEDIKAHVFRTAGSNVGTRGIVSDNSGASGVYAQGGVINWINKDQERTQSWSRKANIDGMECIGAFDIKNWKGDYGYLYRLDDFDKDYYKAVPLKKNEMLFRYTSDATKIGKFFPIVKVNLEKMLIYFLEDLYATDDKNLVFNTKGVKPRFMSVSNVVYDDLVKQENFEMFADGGKIKLGDVVEVKEPNYGYDETYYVVDNKAGYDEKGFLISETRKRVGDVFEEEQLNKLYADGGFMNDVYANGGNLKKYILKADIKTVTVKRNGKEVTYKGADVLNGANVLAKGGDISSKANYIPKRDVIEVELKDGTTVKPANGYWVKKGAEPVGAEPTPTSSGSSEPKISTTEIRKDMRGNWRAETTIDNFNGYDWRLSTIKTYSGNLVSSAQGGKTEATGSKGISMFIYTMYQDPNYTLEVSKPKRLTDKVVTEQHDKALAKFKKFMETGMFKGGGKISNFDKLSAKVAEQYEGKPVQSKYQEEYGKYYSKEEAQEVGNKVAGKVKAMQADKKAFGGLFGGAKNFVTPSKKYPNIVGKQGLLKSGQYVQVFEQNDNKISVLELNKMGSGVRPHYIDISEVEIDSFKAGGKIAEKRVNGGTETLKRANELAKEIRKDGESWLDAKKRAFAQLKK
jgi:hypothetical protein